MKHTLKADSIRIAFNDTTLLSDVSLSVETGEIVGLLGLNGCGKSILLKIIFGRQFTFDKHISIDGQLVKTPKCSARDILYLPQHDFLPVHLSLKKVVHRFLADKESQQAVLSHPLIERHYYKRITQLSGGESRFFEVLLLMNMTGKFVLLDEPFSGIEPKYKKLIGELLNEYRHKKGFIITDHDYANILKFSDRICLLNKGCGHWITDHKQLEKYQYVPQGTFDLKKRRTKEEKCFSVDQQTLSDLDVWKDKSAGAILKLFEGQTSPEARQQIHNWMRKPLIQIDQLEERKEALKYLSAAQGITSFSAKQLKLMQHYLDSESLPVKDHPLEVLWLKWSQAWNSTNAYYLMTTGIQTIFQFIDHMVQIKAVFQQVHAPELLKKMTEPVERFQKQVKPLLGKDSQSLYSIVKVHNFICRRGRAELMALIEAYYKIEALTAVSAMGRKKGWSYPSYVKEGDAEIEVKELFHPLLNDPVKNDFHFKQEQHLCFLTGANMAGKSTFLKAFTLSIYLAHLGFPVPASTLRLSVFNGMMSSINLTDNIEKGQSHFYCEVNRVKEAAFQLKENGRMLIVFDELFKGTNIKDATDASLTVVKAMLKIPNAFAMVSTHIVELAEELKNHPKVQFRCFQTKWNQQIPQYTYKLKSGVSSDRMGMYIVENEGVLEILEELMSEELKG